MHHQPLPGVTLVLILGQPSGFLLPRHHRKMYLLMSCVAFEQKRVLSVGYLDQRMVLPSDSLL